MFQSVVTKDPAAVEMAVQEDYLSMFPNGDRFYVPRVFGWAHDCFSGNYRDYQAIDARYHDFEHTLQGTLCMGRLLRARHFAGAEPRLTQRSVELGILAILLHDTGYLKKRHDTSGTGAKYTIVHVTRSAEFAEELLREKMFDPGEIQAIQNMIHCTGVDATLNVIPFQNPIEKVVGFALGTSDLLGQMAAEDYVEKLPILYSEFAEATRFSEDRTHFIGAFSSASDLMLKTPVFWSKYVLPKLDRDFGRLYQYLNDPYPSGPNEYLQRVEANMERLKAKMAPVQAETV
jgi:hypothetical protein